jgi:glutaminyl-peptide cyclotransferase
MRRISLLLALVFPMLPLPARGAAPPPLFDQERAYRDLVKQCEFGPRVPGTRAHAQCADWLVAQLKPLADSVVRQQFAVQIEGKSVRLTNLIATFNPKAKEHVLLCAHWDTRPRAECDPDPAKRGQPILGANDGASGVAVLLEIARALKAHPPKQKVTLVFFDGEDYGADVDTMFLGSRHFAAHYTGRPPDWAVLLDMVGDKDLRLPQERNSLERAPEVVTRLWNVAQRAGSTAFLPKPGPSILDDHIPLLDRGIPCIDIIDFTYPPWHTAADTPDKCAPESLGQVGRAVLEAVEKP